MEDKPDCKSMVLASAPNFRDFGGYLTTCGRMVKSGRLFRSELLHELTEDEIERVHALGIRLVCDLRTPFERQRHPNRWVNESMTMTLASSDDLEASAVRASDWREKLRIPDFDAVKARAWLLESYRGMPQHYAPCLAGVIEQLIVPDAPIVLIHCAAGKDRTGFVCAMLLWALGVPWPTIVQDYLLTGQLRPATVLAERLGERYKSASERARAALHVIAGVDIAFLDAAFESAVRQFGSVDNYLMQGCGLTTAVQQRLRNQLLAS